MLLLLMIVAADDVVILGTGDGCSVKGLAAVSRDVDSAPLRDGGRGTAMLPSVGVLPREPGAGSRPCFGGSAGTISPTSSNKSSPAGVDVFWRLAGEFEPEGVMPYNEGAPPTGVDVLELVGLWNRFNPTKSLLD